CEDAEAGERAWQVARSQEQREEDRRARPHEYPGYVDAGVGGLLHHGGQSSKLFGREQCCCRRRVELRLRDAEHEAGRAHERPAEPENQRELCESLVYRLEHYVQRERQDRDRDPCEPDAEECSAPDRLMLADVARRLREGFAAPGDDRGVVPECLD